MSYGNGSHQAGNARRKGGPNGKLFFKLMSPPTPARKIQTSLGIQSVKDLPLVVPKKKKEEMTVHDFTCTSVDDRVSGAITPALQRCDGVDQFDGPAALGSIMVSLLTGLRHGSYIAV